MLRLDSSDIHQIDVLAKKLRGRDFLNVTLNAQRNWDNYMQALEAWRDAIEEKGIFVFRWPFRYAHLSGFSLYDEEFPVICLDSQETKGRQIFTLLHELAHVLHGESSVTLDKDGLEVKGKNIQEAEHYFDGFAGTVLVPRDDLERQILQGDIRNEDFYIRKAKQYKVSPLMLLVRSRLTNLIPYNVFMNVRESLGTYSGNDQESSGGNYYLNYLSYWGKAFLHNILNKRHQNRISEYEMSQVLNMKIKNIETLEGYLMNKQLGT